MDLLDNKAFMKIVYAILICGLELLILGTLGGDFKRGLDIFLSPGYCDGRIIGISLKQNDSFPYNQYFKYKVSYKVNGEVYIAKGESSSTDLYFSLTSTSNLDGANIEYSVNHPSYAVLDDYNVTIRQKISQYIFVQLLFIGFIVAGLNSKRIIAYYNMKH